ncbi:hypothetical protein N0B28_14960 [Pseudomonas sp. SD17-1]|jgi:hypothetical protein|uniref:hypothetical protein n=1 Tax=Pseudomonas TaxID=286 RepID=UPI0023DB7EF1|nr:hypothetical protein [Pseudomonas sp. SD17-1]WEJ19597.1 hypothetical protein N0B28_14960 [Pseudomonas sp. SD17-1]
MSRFVGVFHLRSRHAVDRGFKVHALHSDNHAGAHLEAGDIRNEQGYQDDQTCDFTVIEIASTAQAPRRLSWLERITGKLHA